MGKRGRPAEHPDEDDPDGVSEAAGGVSGQAPPPPAPPVIAQAPPPPAPPVVSPAPPAPPVHSGQAKQAIAVDYPIMVCPHCASKDTHVLPNQERENHPDWRRRQCKGCQRKFKEHVPGAKALAQKA